ncbi:hypothetical protein FF38_14146 [Lucilia cuprina]|uniref:MobA-like NTP transferase domain-containing protein n=1 Tax=Lucilia cuprina TaxID=7375 RepID=A0A0L0CCM0_LUCCU|nr:hypothetical protein FF38_14146 [Lucilia cuprina]
MNIGILILAAGKSERFQSTGGRGSKLNHLLDKQTVFEKTLSNSMSSGLPLHVVTRADNDGVINNCLQFNIPFSVLNSYGLGESIAVGVQNTPNWHGWLIQLGDMPYIPREIFIRIADELKNYSLVRPVYKNIPGHPVEENPSASNTAIVSLTHDPRIDDLTLMEAVNTSAFYIGAMGSTRTSAKRPIRWIKVEPVWLCTVLNTYGSSPRSPGSLLVAKGDGSYTGSLSGGCIEEDFLQRIQQGHYLENSQVVRYGQGGVEAKVNLPCEGSLDVLIEYLPCNERSYQYLTQIQTALLGYTAIIKKLTLPNMSEITTIPNSQHPTQIERNEPANLGYGWVNFDLESAFNCPVKIINDAAMQATGSYDGGKMLFLGLGTGLGSSLVVNNEVISLELGHLNYLDHNYEYFTCDAYRQKNGNKNWEDEVLNITDDFYQVFMPDYIVLGGGNVVRLNNLPEYVRRGGNDKAFIGGMKMWNE